MEKGVTGRDTVVHVTVLEDEDIKDSQRLVFLSTKNGTAIGVVPGGRNSSGHTYLTDLDSRYIRL